MSSDIRASAPLMMLRRAFVGALLVPLYLGGCGGDPGAAAGEDEQAIPAVEAVPARSGALPREEVLTGVVRARNQVAIRPEIEATVVRVLVDSGEAVEQGQPLVRLEDAPLRDRLRQAEADLRSVEAAAAEARARVAEVEAEVGRMESLAGEGLVSEMELDTGRARLAAARAQATQAEARVEQVRATVEERRSDLSESVVRSPVSGRVGRRDAEVGMLVDPATTLFLVGDLEELIVEVPLTEAMLQQVDVGTPVRVRPRGADGAAVEGTLSRISPFLEPGSFSTTGEVHVENREGRLRPGMFVTVVLLYGESERGTLVPASAVWEDPGTGIRGAWVLTAAPGDQEPGGEMAEEPRRVSFRPVEVLAEGQGMAGVRGVEEGEWVVTVGHHLLHDQLRSEDPVAAEETGRSGAASAAREALARVRATTWERVLELQGLQREDLLREFLDKQRRVARALGSEIPESEAVVDEVLSDGEGVREQSTEPQEGPGGGGPGPEGL